MEDMKLTAVFVEGEYGYTAYIDEMKGVITQGRTIPEAEENLFDALQVYLSPDEEKDVLNAIDGSKNVIRKPFLSISKAI